MGGAGSGSSFQANIAALQKKRFNMRVMHGITRPDTSTTLFGKKLTLPLLAAPVGGVWYNMTRRLKEQDFIAAVVQGCKEAGIIGCLGDGELEEIFDSACATLQVYGGWGIPFIKPWQEGEALRKIERMRLSGIDTVGMDIDAAGLITLHQMGKPVYPKTQKELARIINAAGVQFIVKGIMTVDEAKAALDAGAAGIVVSNHGGRVLDHTPGTADVLPAVAEAVGAHLTVLADGGVRTGGDILKMMALGAHGVMAGRPFAISAIGGGADGVRQRSEKFQRELVQAMILTGCGSISGVSSSILYRE